MYVWQDYINNAMRSKRNSEKVSGSVFWELFFQMMYSCPVPTSVFVTADLLEKVLILAPVVSFIYNNTSWTYIRSAANCFVVQSILHQR